MALSFLDNVDYRGKKPNFTRDLFSTIAEMASYSENYLPEVFLTVCAEDGKAYIYNRNNEVDPTLGKWRPVDATEDPASQDSFYYGVAKNIDSINFNILTAIPAANHIEISISADNEYVIIACPKDNGTPNIYDMNNLCYDTSFNKRDGIYSGIEYDIYVSQNKVTCQNFIYKIIY